MIEELFSRSVRGFDACIHTRHYRYHNVATILFFAYFKEENGQLYHCTLDSGFNHEVQLVCYLGKACVCSINIYGFALIWSLKRYIKQQRLFNRNGFFHLKDLAMPCILCIICRGSVNAKMDINLCHEIKLFKVVISMMESNYVFSSCLHNLHICFD